MSQQEIVQLLMTLIPLKQLLKPIKTFLNQT